MNDLCFALFSRIGSGLFPPHTLSRWTLWPLVLSSILAHIITLTGDETVFGTLMVMGSSLLSGYTFRNENFYLEIMLVTSICRTFGSMGNYLLSALGLFIMLRFRTVMMLIVVSIASATRNDAGLIYTLLETAMWLLKMKA